MFTVKITKAGFFDRKAVTDALDKATVRIFKAFGRAVRRTALASLKYVDGPSKAGDPPHAHKSATKTTKSKSTGRIRTRSVSFLKEFLFFAYDKSTKSVVIGPARLGSTVSADAPHALEYGGTSTVEIRGKQRRATIAARPFMRPAAAKGLPGLPAMWRDSVR